MRGALWKKDDGEAFAQFFSDAVQRALAAVGTFALQKKYARHLCAVTYHGPFFYLGLRYWVGVRVEEQHGGVEVRAVVAHQDGRKIGRGAAHLDAHPYGWQQVPQPPLADAHGAADVGAKNQAGRHDLGDSDGGVKNEIQQAQESSEFFHKENLPSKAAAKVD